MSDTSKAGSGPRGGRPTKEQAASKRRELNARQRAYVVWASTPPAEREIKSVQELAEVLGVSFQQVYKWGKDPRVVEAIRFCTLQNAGSPDKIQAILDMVFQQAMERRDVRMAEVWMKGTGVMGSFGRSADILEIVEDIESEVTIADLSVDELQRIRDLAVAERAELAAVELARRELPNRTFKGSDGSVGVVNASD